MPTLCQDLQVRIVEAELDGSATVDFTVTGFGTPKFAMILWGSSGPAGGSRASSYGIGSVGFWCANGQFSNGWRQDNAVAVSNTARSSSTTRAATAPDGAGSSLSVEYTASAITDGIRLTKVTHTLSSPKFCQVMLWGGTAVKNVDVGSLDANGSTQITGISDGGAFTPNYVMFGTSGQAVSAGVATNATYSFGWAMENYNGAGTGTFKQGCMAWRDLDGYSTTNSAAHLSNSKALVKAGTSGTGISATSFASGVVNFTEDLAASNFVNWIAIEFDHTKAGMMVERMSNWKHDETGATEAIEKTANLSADADNFAAVCIAPTISVGSIGVDSTSATHLLNWGIHLYDPTGVHGGISQMSEDAAATSVAGGQVNDSFYWRQPDQVSAGGGRSWQGQWFAREQGGGIRYEGSYGPTTAYVANFTVLAWGAGTRNLYHGDGNMMGILQDSTSKVAVYKGSTLLYGDDSF